MRWLLGVDLDQSAPLIAAAIAWAHPHRARLDLLYADPAGRIADQITDPALQQMVLTDQGRQKVRFRVQLETLMNQVPAAHRGQVIVDSGPAAEALLDRAEAYDAIGVGTHGRQGLDRVLLGSVAERICRLSPVPVIVFRPGGGQSSSKPYFSTR